MWLILYIQTPPWGQRILDHDLVNLPHANLIHVCLILMKIPIILQ